jgi:hypothetical protein
MDRVPDPLAAWYEPNDVTLCVDYRGSMMASAESEGEQVPSWWNPSGERKGTAGFGVLAGGYLRQSEQEAIAWANARGLTPPAAGLSAEEVKAVRTYSDGDSHVQINASFYEGLETPVGRRLRAALGRSPIGAVQPVWYKLRVRPGVRGLFIAEIAVKGAEERELLLQPGTRILIDVAKQRGERWYILATALP